MTQIAQWLIDHAAETLYTVISGGVIFGFRYIWKHMKAQKAEQKAQQSLMLALTRDHIIGSYNRCAEKGFCPLYELDNLNALHKEYKALGGNGMIDDLMIKVEHMPTSAPPFKGTT